MTVAAAFVFRFIRKEHIQFPHCLVPWNQGSLVPIDLILVIYKLWPGLIVLAQVSWMDLGVRSGSFKYTVWVWERVVYPKKQLGLLL